MSQRVLSLCIGDQRVVAVELATDWSGTRLQNRMVLQLPSEPEEPEETIHFVASRIEEAGLSGDRVVLALGAERAYLRRIDFPFSSREKIEQALPLEMEATLPLSQDDLVFDSYYLGKNSKGGSKVLAAALPKVELEQWIHFLREQGLEPARIDLTLSALPGIGALASSLISGPNMAVWHLGQSVSYLAILHNDSLVQARSFRLGTRDLAQTLAGRMNTTLEAAWQHIERGVFSAQTTSDSEQDFDGVQEAVNASVGQASRELMRSVWAVQDESPEVVIGDILLTGPGSRLRGIASALAAKEDMRFHSVHDLEFPITDISDVDKEELPEVAVASCLPRSEKRSGAGWNFRKGEFAYHGSSWRRTIISGAVGLGILLFCAVATFSYHLWLKKQEMQAVQTKTEQVFREAVPGSSESLRPAQYASVLQNRIRSYQEQSANAVRNAAELSPLELLLYISKSAPDEESFRLKRLTMDTRETLLVGNAGSYDTVNRIREAMLSEQGVETVQIQGVTANQGEDTVRFTLRVEAGE